MKKANKTFGGPSYFARKIKYLSLKFGIDLGYFNINPMTKDGPERNQSNNMLIKEQELKEAIDRTLQNKSELLKPELNECL